MPPSPKPCDNSRNSGGPTDDYPYILNIPDHDILSITGRDTHVFVVDDQVILQETKSGSGSYVTRQQYPKSKLRNLVRRMLGDIADQEILIFIGKGRVDWLKEGF